MKHFSFYIINLPLMIIFSLLSLLVGYGCATTKYIYTEKEIRSAVQVRLEKTELETLVIPFSSTSEMKHFTKKATQGIHSHHHKAVAIVEAMLRKWNLEYNLKTNLTAEQAFEYSQANCLTFTNLFVSLSRSIGMNTVFVDVPQIRSTYEKNNIIINSGHICAGLYDGGQFYLIDFSPVTEIPYRIYHEIDDLEAIANYYNNLAYQYTQTPEYDVEKVLNLYNLATRIKPEFTRAYNNRGVLFSKTGYATKAKREYLKALEIDPDMPEANWNLSGIYSTEGNFIEALSYLEKAVSGMPCNPYYRYRLGWVFLHLDKEDKALKEFKLAIRRNPAYAQPYLGLGFIHEKNNRLSAAISKYRKALKLNPDLEEARSRLDSLQINCILKLFL